MWNELCCEHWNETLNEGVCRQCSVYIKCDWTCTVNERNTRAKKTWPIYFCFAWNFWVLWIEMPNKFCAKRNEFLHVLFSSWVFHWISVRQFSSSFRICAIRHELEWIKKKKKPKRRENDALVNQWLETYSRQFELGARSRERKREKKNHLKKKKQQMHTKFGFRHLCMLILVSGISFRFFSEFERATCL